MFPSKPLRIKNKMRRRISHSPHGYQIYIYICSIYLTSSHMHHSRKSEWWGGWLRFQILPLRGLDNCWQGPAVHPLAPLGPSLNPVLLGKNTLDATLLARSLWLKGKSSCKGFDPLYLWQGASLFHVANLSGVQNMSNRIWLILIYIFVKEKRKHRSIIYCKWTAQDEYLQSKASDQAEPCQRDATGGKRGRRTLALISQETPGGGRTRPSPYVPRTDPDNFLQPSHQRTLVWKLQSITLVSGVKERAYRTYCSPLYSMLDCWTRYFAVGFGRPLRSRPSVQNCLSPLLPFM